jgi:hypothetical protein
MGVILSLSAIVSIGHSSLFYFQVRVFFRIKFSFVFTDLISILPFKVPMVMIISYKINCLWFLLTFVLCSVSIYLTLDVEPAHLRLFIHILHHGVIFRVNTVQVWLGRDVWVFHLMIFNSQRQSNQE